MSCQTNKGSGPHKSLRLGRSPACLGEGSQAAIFYPSPSTAPLPAARTSRSSAGTGWRAHAAQHAKSRRSTSSLPSPCPARPADNAHTRAQPGRRARAAPGARQPLAQPEPAVPTAQGGDSAGGGKPQPPAFGAAGGRQHSSPSPRVNSSRARTAPRLHPPAGLRAAPRPRVPPAGAAAPYLVGEFEHCHSSAPSRSHAYRSPVRRCHARSRGSGRDCQGKGKKSGSRI